MTKLADTDNFVSRKAPDTTPIEHVIPLWFVALLITQLFVAILNCKIDTIIVKLEESIAIESRRDAKNLFFFSSQWLSYLFHFPRVFSFFCLSLSPILVRSFSCRYKLVLFYNVHFSSVSLLPPLNNENVFLKHPLTTVTLSASRVRSNVAKNIRIFFFFSSSSSTKFFLQHSSWIETLRLQMRVLTHRVARNPLEWRSLGR